MKINYLYISGYKNLKEFEMNIEHDSIVNAIIGINGSGKSNILEALTQIFVSLLTKADEYKFRYDLRYLLDGHSVVISNKEGSQVISKDGKKVFKKDIESILPRNIFLYYSGETSRLRELTEGTVDKRFERILKKDEDIALKYTTYLSVKDFGACLLANFVYKNQTFDKICELINLASIEMPVKFKLRRPSWGKKNQASEFWGAKGTVGYELRKLADKGIFEVLDGDAAVIEIGDIDKLRDDSTGAIGLFTVLKVLDQADVLETIEFDIIKDGNQFDFSLLSEGEKQLSQLLSILEITKDYKAIFLLDEFDSYLHPKWQRLFVEILNGIDIRGQVIFTTHSPLTLGKMESENIILLREGKAYNPSSGTLNRDVSEILEEIMEVGRRPEDVEKSIRNFNRCVVKKDLDCATKMLEELKEVLSEEDPFFISAKISMNRLNRGK